MPSPTYPESLDRIPAPVLLRWMTKAALLGLFLGVAAAVIALLS